MSLMIQHVYAPLPGGEIVLNIPERGLVGKGNRYDMLRGSIVAYRNANAIPVGLGLDEEICAELCKVIPGACQETNYTPPPRTLQWNEVISGTMAIAKFKLAGSPFVSDEEALRRASVCSVCPHNQAVKMPCTACRWDDKLRELAIGITGVKSTPLDAKLISCDLCGCALPIIIHLPLDIQHQALSDRAKEDFRKVGCWKSEGL
jgi:hypothetical protein